MLAVGIASLQVLLDKGQEKDWFATNWITGFAILSILALTVFVIYELIHGIAGSQFKGVQKSHLRDRRVSDVAAGRGNLRQRSPDPSRFCKRCSGFRRCGRESPWRPGA